MSGSAAGPPDPTPLGFDLTPVPSGYAWWYLDAISDDGRYGLVLILFLGSVFSPRYARARREAAGAGAGVDPLTHAAVNFAIYPLTAGPGRGAKLWSFNEGGPVERSREHLQIGATRMQWRDAGRELVVDLAEHSTHFFGRRGAPLRARLRLTPATIFAPRVELDSWRERPRHRWYPVAPHARVEFELEAPALRFSGSGYHDVNEGDEGLEQGFASWNWSRCELGEESVISYDVVAPSGQARAQAWRFAPATQTISTLDADALGPDAPLPTSRWRVPRSVRGGIGAPRLLSTLEDTPFYSRNLVELGLDGARRHAVHESVDLRRYAAPWVQFLLPFKISRYAPLEAMRELSQP